MILRSFSKINLSLSINKRLKNGLHDIQSYFCLINLFDQIKIKSIKSNKDVIKFKGKFAKHVKKNNNSIVKTLTILRKKKLISNYYSVEINKKIPVFAGLGGGTGNAACLIKKFIGKKINRYLFNYLEKKIGSDLKLFFFNQGYLNGLKKINTFNRKYRLHFLLIFPNIRMSTKYVYSKIIKFSAKSKYDFNKIKNTKQFIKHLGNKNNDLQSIVEKKYSTIKKLIKKISQKKGCYFARMTGSGSVCFGLFKSQKTAKAALSKMQLKYPKFWFLVTKTI